MRIWHYTTFDALEEIFHDGKIRCDTIIIEGEIPCVWLSTNARWEESVRKTLYDPTTGIETPALSRDGLFKAGILPIRIEINHRNVKITDWEIHCKKIPKKIAQELEHTAQEWGANPEEWWVSYQPIPIKSFVSPIEMWDGKQWIKSLVRK